jgi:hypothetical protein
MKRRSARVKKVKLSVDEILEMVYCVRDNCLNDAETKNYVSKFLAEIYGGEILANMNK